MKNKQRTAMRKVNKAMAIANLVLDHSKEILKLLNVGATDHEIGDTTTNHMVELRKLGSTPTKCFRLDKPQTDKRRVKRGNNTDIWSDVRATSRLILEKNIVIHTPGHKSLFEDLYLCVPENSEYDYLTELHHKNGFSIPNNCSLRSLRASYNFKAVKAGIETHKWSN